MNRSRRSTSVSGPDQSLNQSKRAGRMKVIPTHFQKSGNSLSSIIQAGSYKRKVKELLKRNKDLAVSYQNVKIDLARSNQLLQECSNNNTSILLAKKKLKSLVLTVQELVSGINEVATCLDMKQFRFLTSTDDEWKLRLPPQALDPIDESNSIIEDANLSTSECIIRGKHSGLPETPVSANLSDAVKVGDNQAEIADNQPKPVLNASSDSLGTPVLCLSPLPPKRNIFSTDDISGAPPSKRARTPDGTTKTPSPKVLKFLSDSKSPKPHIKTPPKTSPRSSKNAIVTKSPKHSKIPQIKRIAPLPEPVIKPPLLSSCRKTFVIPKDVASSEYVTSNKSPGAEKIILPEIMCNDTNVSGNVVHSLRRETFQIPRSTTVENSNSVAKVLPLVPNTTSSDDMELTAMLPLIKPPETTSCPQPSNDDMELTAMLPLIKPPETISCPQPSNDDMELTSVLPSLCFLNNQSNALPLKQIEIDPPVPMATGEKTLATDSLVVSAPENITFANSVANPTAKNKKKSSLRIKKSLCVKNREVAELEPDENCQPGTKSNAISIKTKRFSIEDTSMNVTRKSVQFTFNDCYNAFQNIKTKGEAPKSILKPAILDCEQSKSKSPESPKKVIQEENKQIFASLQFSASDDSSVIQTLSPDLFPENSHKNKREFSGVSERRSKKKTVSGDVFSEIDIPEESSPDSLVPSLSNFKVNPKTVLESDSHTQQKNINEPLQLKEPETLAKSPNLQLKEPETLAKSPNLQLKEPEKLAKSPNLQLKEPETLTKSPNLQLKVPETLAKSPNLRSKDISSEKDLATEPKEIVRVLHAVSCPKTVEIDVLIKPPEATSDKVEPQRKKKRSKGVRKKQKSTEPVTNPPILEEESNLKVEIETDLTSTKESTSIGIQRERRSRAQKSYKEPSLKDKKRRE